MGLPTTETNTHAKVISLDHIITLISGRDAPLDACNDQGKGIPYILGASNLSHNKFTAERWIEKPIVVSKKGDLLLSVKGTVGTTYLQTEEEIGISRQIMALRPSSDLNLIYLQYYLEYTCDILKKISIGLIPGISRKNILDTKIPLPPLAEQHRIVAKIEELFAELDRGIAGLEKAKAQLKTYRQAVLKGAFPTTCTYAPLGEYAEMCLGKMLDKSKNQGSLQPYLRNINVRWFSVDLSDILEMRFEDRDDERYNIVNGDLVICEGGEPGRCAIWKFDYPIKIQKALHRVRTNSSLNATYLMYYLRYLSHTNDITKYFTGTTIKHLTGQSLKKIRIPIVDINKQQQIVSAIETRLSFSDSLEKSIDSSLKSAELLRLSLLKKAFAGELTTVDYKDPETV